MIALAVFITLALCMVAPFFLLKPSPLTEREQARINEYNAWAAEAQAKLDAIQAKSDALTAQAAAKAKVEVQVVEFNAADHAEKYVNDHWCETFESALRVANEAIADGAADVAVAPCEGLYVVMVNY